MIKAIGANLIVKVTKKKSMIDLSATTTSHKEEVSAVIESLGTKCTLGLEVGHEVVVKANTMPIIVSQDEEKGEDLLLIPEHSIAYVTNFSE